MSRLALALIVVLTSCPGYAADSAVVLMYHRFGEDRFPSTSIRTDQFEAQLDYLASGDAEVIPLERLLESLAGNGDLPDHAVVITIDDAYRSVYDVAHPRLLEHRFPYTVFVATDGVDAGLPDLMSWSQMRELARDGVTFANHGASHGSLIDRSLAAGDRDYLERAVADVEKGRERLQAELEPIPRVFAYPYGEYNTPVADALAEFGIAFAFGQHSGPAARGSNPMALPRFPMNEAYADMDEFRLKLRSVPLPVRRVEPADPEVAERMPNLTVTLAANAAIESGLACFVGGQGRVEVRWRAPSRRFEVAPLRPLAAGRNRVNCTAPAGDGRYHWFSHPWFVQP